MVGVGDERGNIDTKVVILVGIYDDADFANAGDDVGTAVTADPQHVGLSPSLLSSQGDCH